jgi:methylthioribulose-1-phosphate dehydratase
MTLELASHLRLSQDSLAARTQLVALSARYHAMGWMLGTSGNLSARFAEDCVVITASSCDKGALTPDDFVELGLNAELQAAPVGRRPSAETCIHLAIYRALPEVGSVLHVHTVASTLLGSGSSVPTTFELTGLEMIKGWDLWKEGDVATLPLLANHHDVRRIADDTSGWLKVERTAPAMVIQGHGITSWGDRIETAHRHLEITEFFCQLLHQKTHSD